MNKKTFLKLEQNKLQFINWSHNRVFKITGLVSFVFFILHLSAFFFFATMSIFDDILFVLTGWPSLFGPFINLFAFFVFIFVPRFYRYKGIQFEFDSTDRFFKKYQIVYLLLSPILLPLLIFLAVFSGGGWH